MRMLPMIGGLSLAVSAFVTVVMAAEPTPGNEAPVGEGAAVLPAPQGPYQSEQMKPDFAPPQSGLLYPPEEEADSPFADKSENGGASSKEKKAEKYVEAPGVARGIGRSSTGPQPQVGPWAQPMPGQWGSTPIAPGRIAPGQIAPGQWGVPWAPPLAAQPKAPPAAASNRADKGQGSTPAVTAASPPANRVPGYPPMAVRPMGVAPQAAPVMGGQAAGPWGGWGPSWPAPRSGASQGNTGTTGASTGNLAGGNR